MANRGQSTVLNCIFDYHNDNFLFWHVQMQDFQKQKLKAGIIPNLLIREKFKDYK